MSSLQCTLTVLLAYSYYFVCHCILPHSHSVNPRPNITKRFWLSSANGHLELFATWTFFIKSATEHIHSCRDILSEPTSFFFPDLAALVDEGIGSASPSSQSEGEERGGGGHGELLAQLRQQLQQERELRMRLEGELRGLHKKDHDYTEVSFNCPLDLFSVGCGCRKFGVIVRETNYFSCVNLLIENQQTS